MRFRVVAPPRVISALEGLAVRAYPREAFAVLLGYASREAGGVTVTLRGYVGEGAYYRVVASTRDSVLFTISARSLAVPAHVGLWHTHPLPPLNAPPALVLDALRRAARPSPPDVETFREIAAGAGRELAVGVTAVTRAPWGFQSHTRFYIVDGRAVREAVLEAG